MTQGGSTEGTDIRLIPVDGPEIEVIRNLPVQEDVVILGPEAINVLRSIASRYSDGISQADIEGEMFATARKIRSAFTPTTEEGS